MCNKNIKMWANFIRLFLLILGVIFIGIGSFLGEPLDIYRKALFICMECIGIG